MACDVKQAYGTKGAEYTAPVSGNKQSDAVVQAALQNLEELLGTLLASTETTTKGIPSSLLGEVLSELTAQLKIVLSSDPAKGGELIANFVPFFNQLVENDPSAMAQIEEEFGKLFNDYAAENKDKPNNLYAVLQGMGKTLLPTTDAEEQPSEEETTSTTSNIFDYNGKSMTAIAATMALVDHDDDERQRAQQKQVGQMVTEQGEAAVKEAEKQMQELIDRINTMNRLAHSRSHASNAFGAPAAKPTFGALDLGTGVGIVNYCPVLSLATMAVETLKFDIESAEDSYKTKASPEPTTKEDQPSEESTSSTSAINFNSILAYDGASFADIEATMAVAIQAEEVAQTKQQSKVGVMLTEQGDAQIKEAEKKQQELADAIKAMRRAQRRARHSQAAMLGMSIAIAVVAVAVTALTLGVGAALVVMAVTAFMMSPAFKMAVGALSSEIQKGTPLSAHEADILAKMTILVAVVLVSGGVAYATSSGTTATAAAEEAGAAAAEEGAGTAGNTAIQNATAFAEMQFWTNLAAMNPMEDGIEQLRENGQISDQVAIALNVACVLVCMFMLMRPQACGLGASPMTRMAANMGKSSPFALGAESFLAKNYTVVSNWSQRIQGTMELLMAGAHARMAKAYSEIADSQEKQAEVMGETQLVQTLLAMNTSLQKSSQQTMQGSLKGLQDALQIITDEAGTAMGAAAYVIAHT